MKKKYISFPYIVLALVFISCLISFIGELFLSWDGSLIFSSIVQHESFHHVRNRLFPFVLQIPLLLVKKVFSSHLQTLINVYGLVYSFIPFYIITFLYYILKNEKISLFYIASLGVLVPTMILQFHPVSEHLIVCQLSLVLFSLIYFYTKKNEKYLSMLIVSFVLFYLHPVSAIVFAFAFLYLWILHHRNNNNQIKKLSLFFLLDCYFCFIIKMYIPI